MKSLMLFLFITILEITSIEIASNYLLVDLENQKLNSVGRSALQSRELKKPCQPDDEVFGYKVCNTYIRGWTYDPMPSEDDWDCRQFGAWGCGYATNGFKTEQECKDKCAFPIKQRKIMRACCEGHGVPMDLCISKNDVHSDSSLLKSRRTHGHELLKVIEYCYSTSISADVNGNGPDHDIRHQSSNKTEI